MPLPTTNKLACSLVGDERDEIRGRMSIRIKLAGMNACRAMTQEQGQGRVLIGELEIVHTPVMHDHSLELPGARSWEGDIILIQ